MKMIITEIPKHIFKPKDFYLKSIVY